MGKRYEVIKIANRTRENRTPGLTRRGLETGFNRAPRQSSTLLMWQGVETRTVVPGATP